MPYPVLPDRRMPFDNDGTVVGYNVGLGGYGGGVVSYLTGTERIELNDYDRVNVTVAASAAHWFFFPEQREITAIVEWFYPKGSTGWSWISSGSNDSVNGLDGTWETPSYGSGTPDYSYDSMDNWRSKIKPISFTGGKRIWRRQWLCAGGIGDVIGYLVATHIYGKKVAGQTPDDIIYIDFDTTGLEFTAPEDFGDRPLGTTVIRQFKVKNASATKTANNINLQLNDADFVMSDNAAGPWVATWNIVSLIAGASSVTLYTKNTTPPPGNPLGPRFARIVTTVGSYT